MNTRDKKNRNAALWAMLGGAGLTSLGALATATGIGAPIGLVTGSLGAKMLAGGAAAGALGGNLLNNKASLNEADWKQDFIDEQNQEAVEKRNYDNLMFKTIAAREQQFNSPLVSGSLPEDEIDYSDFNNPQFSFMFGTTKLPGDKSTPLPVYKDNRKVGTLHGGEAIFDSNTAEMARNYAKNGKVDALGLLLANKFMKMM